ncbi:MAG: CDP-alcohol phosphatidyltransferase family protein [Caldilineaceae bacterium]|nr:CDP-alcohol phosphatidyltransferase family protein [Caldilineaceae bacterium]
MAQMEDVYLEPTEEWSPSLANKVLAWSAHLLTATGAIWGLFSILAISSHQWLLAFIWMALSVFVDSFDGIWARRVRVKSVLPNFDGALLDNMIDFLNYVVVPAYFLHESQMLPSQYALTGAAFILLASAYQFCQGDAKTEDHYFKGFPSYWNIMVYYMFVLGWSPWVNLAVTVLLSALVFVPIKYVYPTRTAIYQRLTMTLACIWGVVNVVILVQYPDYNPWLVWASLLFVIYYCWLSFYAMLQDRKQAA